MKTQMKTTKRFSVILSLTLLTAVFVIAGCGKSQGQNNDTSATAAAVEQNNDPPIITAIKNEDLKAVKKLLDNDKSLLNLSYKTSLDSNIGAGWVHGNSLLHYAAAYNKNTDISKLLLDSGLDVNNENIYQETPLHWAAAKNSLTFIKFLIENGANRCLVDYFDCTPFHKAVARENVEIDILKLLLDSSGVDIKKKRASGMSLILEARNVITAEFLLENGANYHVVSGNGSTPLHMAAERGNVELVNFWLELGLDINARLVSPYQRTPLFLAIQSDDAKYDCIKLLISNGAKFIGYYDTLEMPTSLGELEKRPSMSSRTRKVDAGQFWAACRSDVETLDLLIQDGIEIKDDIIFWTAKNPNAVRALKILESKGVNITNINQNYRKTEGTNLLHEACAHGNIDLIKYLVKNGIDINARTKDQRGRGFTPLHLAAVSYKADVDVIEFLLKSGADPTIKSNALDFTDNSANIINEYNKLLRRIDREESESVSTQAILSSGMDGSISLSPLNNQRRQVEADLDRQLSDAYRDSKPVLPSQIASSDEKDSLLQIAENTK
jgi:ankyrin repeat protein